MNEHLVLAPYIADVVVDIAGGYEDRCPFGYRKRSMVNPVVGPIRGCPYRDGGTNTRKEGREYECCNVGEGGGIFPHWFFERVHSQT